jgi:hypothetical protein
LHRHRWRDSHNEHRHDACGAVSEHQAAISPRKIVREKRAAIHPEQTDRDADHYEQDDPYEFLHEL